MPKLDHHPLPVEPGILWQWFLSSWFLGIPLLGAGVKWFSIRLSLTSSSNPPKRALSTLFFVICSLILHVLKFAGFRIVGKMYNLNGPKFVFSRWSSQFTFTNLYTPRQNNLKSHHCNLIISFVSVWISLKLIVSSWSIQRETSTEFGILTLQRASMGLSDSRETAKKFSRQA